MDRRESSSAVSNPHASTCPCPPVGAPVARTLGTTGPVRVTCC